MTQEPLTAGDVLANLTTVRFGNRDNPDRHHDDVVAAARLAVDHGVPWREIADRLDNPWEILIIKKVYGVQ